MLRDACKRAREHVDGERVGAKTFVVDFLDNFHDIKTGRREMGEEG